MKTPPEPEVQVAATESKHLQRAFEALSRRFRTPLVRYFERRIGRHSESEDLVQEVFMRMADRGRIESVAHMEAYLFTTAANLLRDRRRRLAARAQEVHEPYEDDVHGATRATPTPERTAASTEAIEQLVAALQALPERTRNVWTLYHVEDLPHAAIAQQLGIAISTIEKHLHRANVYLLKKIDRSVW